jgi:hypothetical protein
MLLLQQTPHGYLHRLIASLRIPSAEANTGLCHAHHALSPKPSLVPHPSHACVGFRVGNNAIRTGHLDQPYSCLHRCITSVRHRGQHGFKHPCALAAACTPSNQGLRRVLELVTSVVSCSSLFLNSTSRIGFPGDMYRCFCGSASLCRVPTGWLTHVTPGSGFFLDVSVHLENGTRRLITSCPTIVSSLNVIGRAFCLWLQAHHSGPS